ncbi:ATP/GTP-binding protein [Streptomyces sp. WM4235]|uniref:ATP/GTP-binding protein n=1 Tax=Streptomyces sp. WM4235 TaxID=1415551 RepID=UPI000AE6FFF4|nr:ATP/GTP-binding protein [Streptomyces sp. WM4235]
MLRRAVATTIPLTIAASLSLTLPAYAAAGPCDGAEKFVTICVTEPGHDGSSGTGGNQGKGTNGGGGTGKGSGTPDPDSCEMRILDPQPPAGNPMWEGHEPGDGAIYVNTCASGSGTANTDTIGLTFWSADTPAPAVDPAVLAQRAVDSMLLDRPAIVSPKADGRYTVGVPMWLWVGQGPTTWGPNTASASAGGITVTATAKVSSVAWNMGDGTTVTCATPGTPYTAARGMTPSPDCGHRYRSTSAGQSGARYQGAATSTWTIDWAVTGGGRSGQLTEVRTTPFTVSVGEVQVVGQ